MMVASQTKRPRDLDLNVPVTLSQTKRPCDCVTDLQASL